jgi:predicted DNA-binding protein
MNARFTHTAPDDLNERIEAIAGQKGMTKTAFINMVMADYVGAYEDPGFFNEIRKRIEKIEQEIRDLKKEKK